VKFYVGVFDLHQARHFRRAFISVHRLARRRTNRPFPVGDWIMDSGAFSTLHKHHCYPEPVAEYAREIRRWADNGGLVCVVAQDWMCEPFMLKATGLTVAQHQELTLNRYDQLLEHDIPAPVMPVLQGYTAEDYLRHLDAYGERLSEGAYVGVGSLCKRNGDPVQVETVLRAIGRQRPDLRLHGFGVKTTALAEGAVRDRLYSADSMAWSYHARKHGRPGSDWREAEEFVRRIETMPVQLSLFP
jgi:hypothetical protein